MITMPSVEEILSEIEKHAKLSREELQEKLDKKQKDLSGLVSLEGAAHLVAKELGVTIIAHTPLGQGLLSGKFHRNPELLKDMSRVRRRMLSRKLKKSQTLVDTL